MREKCAYKIDWLNKDLGLIKLSSGSESIVISTFVAESIIVDLRHFLDKLYKEKDREEECSVIDGVQLKVLHS